MQSAPCHNPVATPSEAAQLLSTIADDHRRFARRPCKLNARLTLLETWNQELEAGRQFEVMTRNLSRSGICFLFFQQLFPDDLILLDFGELKRNYRVARVRRLAPNCYEIGAAIVS
jgi:hypothetical protein